MPEFKFRLATVLRLREVTRDERRASLGEALRADNVLVERIEHLAHDVRGLRQSLTSATAPGKIMVDRLLDAQRYELILRGEQHVLDEQRRKLAEEIERRREALMLADREVRVLEKLRETQQERHREEEQRREQQWLDEVAARGHFAAEREP